MRIAKKQAGVTLVEILVVLVILVLGILLIIRIFPGGFYVVQSAANMSSADRLGQAALEALKNQDAARMEAVYASYYEGDVIGFDPNVRPDNINGTFNDFTNSNATIAAQFDTYSSDINKTRYISNETFTIPAPRVDTTTTPPQLDNPVHVLNYGPIFLPDGTNTANLPKYLSVNSAPWKLKVGDARIDSKGPVDDPAAQLTEGQPTVLVDYTGGEIALPPAAYVQTFHVTLTAGANPAQSYSFDLTIPAKDLTHSDGTDGATFYNGGWFSPSDTTLNYASNASPAFSTPFNQWLPGSLVLYRPFTPVSSFSTNDPYQYALASTNYPGTSASGGTDANMGVLQFNPLAAGTNGNAPLQARVSYTVFDWHIIHEDFDVPSGSAGGGSIRLTLDHLKKIGDVQFDQTSYTGLIPYAATGAPGYARDIMMLDTDTGQIVDDTDNGQAGLPIEINDIDENNTNANVVNVSYRAGRITLPSSPAGTPFPHNHVRIFYAGTADWGVAIQVAPRSYQSVSSITNVAQCKIVQGTASLIAYFPLCDADKAVNFERIEYTDSYGNAQVIGGMAAQKISDAPDNTGFVNVDLTGNFPKILPTNQLPDVDFTKPISIGGISGASAQAVVIWRERGQWKVHTVDTLLPHS